MASLKKSIRLLVADDDDDDVLLLSYTLADAGLDSNIHVVADGYDVLKLLKENRSQLFDAVLLDLGLPVLNGIETLQMIRSDPVLRPLPVIITSGSEEFFDVLHNQHPDVRVDGFIRKPVTIESLIEALQPFGCCTEDSAPAPRQQHEQIRCGNSGSCVEDEE